MGRVRIKMRPSDLHKIGADYIDCQRVKNTKGVHGWRYIVEKRLTDEQRELILGFKNTIIGFARYKYAPELVHDTVVILDKCLEVETC